MEYEIFQGNNIEIEEDVNRQLSRGWELYGSLAMTENDAGETWFAQAMIKKEEIENE